MRLTDLFVSHINSQTHNFFYLVDGVRLAFESPVVSLNGESLLNRDGQRTRVDRRNSKIYKLDMQS